MNARTQTQKCTMELRSKQNTPINLTSGERLRQLRLIVYSVKTEHQDISFNNSKLYNTLFEEKKVFYSFDSFHVVMHQILRKLISVDYILYIIKCKMPLPQP
jgi:hypothetical protein